MTTPAPEPPLDDLVTVTGLLLLSDGTPDTFKVRTNCSTVGGTNLAVARFAAVLLTRT